MSTERNASCTDAIDISVFIGKDSFSSTFELIFKEMTLLGLFALWWLFLSSLSIREYIGMSIISIYYPALQDNLMRKYSILRTK